LILQAKRRGAVAEPTRAACGTPELRGFGLHSSLPYIKSQMGKRLLNFRYIRDPKDLLALAATVSACPDAIVTGDNHLLTMKSFKIL
jgi:hypothetical protein